MKNRKPFLFFALALLGLNALVFSAGAESLRVRPTMATYRSGISAQALGHACFAIPLGADARPCHPAAITRVSGSSSVTAEEGVFRGDLFVGNNLRLTPEVIQLLGSDHADGQMIESVLSERRASELQGQVELSYRRLDWGIALTPVRLFYQSYFRNEALTEARLLAFQEESATWQWGHQLDADLSFGFQTRLVHRKFISQKFFLADAYSEAGQKLLTPEDQSLIYLEPGFLYHPADSDWNMQLGAAMVNMALTSKASAFSQRPQFHFSAGIAPEFEVGVFSLGVDAFVHEDTRRALEALTIGAAIELPILQVFASVSEWASGIGIRVPLAAALFSAAFNEEEVQLGTESTAKDSKASFAVGFEF